MAKKKISLGTSTGSAGRLAPELKSRPTTHQQIKGTRKWSAKALDGENLVQRRHIEWTENQIRWRWLMDSYEGGQRYRNATYGPDRKGLPTRNLFRHKREYPNSQEFPSTYQGYASYLATSTQSLASTYGPFPGMLGASPAATAQDDAYEYRRARTPVPEFVAEAIQIHLASVYDQEVHRDGPNELKEWWKNVDNRGTSIDDYMREVLAPILLVLGCIDVCLDHPAVPPGVTIATRRDEMDWRLDSCVISYILPQNMVWWRCDAAGNYMECLVREYADPSDRVDKDEDGNDIDPDDAANSETAWTRDYVRYRYWDADGWKLYNSSGEKILAKEDHPFGRVPILRIRDQVRHRTPHIGKSEYESIAENQLEYYNRDSELIVSDTIQAHPLLSGHQDFCKGDAINSIGPNNILPIHDAGNGKTTSWEYVSPPKDPAESLRRNKQDIRDNVDRRACLLKPAGTIGSTASTVSQSGISKELDATSGKKVLTRIAKTLARAERCIVEYVLMVLRNQWMDEAERDSIKVAYPARFQLHSAELIAAGIKAFQENLVAAGGSPNTEALMLKEQARQLLGDMPEIEYAEIDDEIEEAVAENSKIHEARRSLAVLQIASNSNAGGKGSDVAAGGNDPTGQTAGTMVSGWSPAVR